MFVFLTLFWNSIIPFEAYVQCPYSPQIAISKHTKSLLIFINRLFVCYKMSKTPLLTV